MWPSRHVSSWTVRHKSWPRRWRKVIRLLWQPEICKESTFWYILILLWWVWTDTFDQISQLSGAEVVNRWYQEISFHDFHSEAPNFRSGKSPRNSDKENSQTRVRPLLPTDLASKQDIGGWLWKVCLDLWSTRLIWRDQILRDPMSGRVVVVARYDPPGNVEGCYAANVPPPSTNISFCWCENHIVMQFLDNG